MAWILINLVISLLLPMLSMAETGVPRATEVQVGDSVSFLCNRNGKHSPVWIINETYHNFNRLPNDYNLIVNSEDIIFNISEIKLWMNDTVYGCYYIESGHETIMGVLRVNFNFDGPENTKAKLGNSAFISCNSSIITKNRLSVVWKIDSKYYNPTRLPDIYIPMIHGLLINVAMEELDGRKFQCLFKSDKLQKMGFFTSSTAVLTVSKSGELSNQRAKTSVQGFTYSHQGFYFSNTVTLAWNIAGGCDQPFDYNLIKSNENASENNRTNLHNRNNITLNRNELIVNNSNVYSVYIEASEDGNQTCNVSEAYVVIPTGVNTQTVYVAPGSNQCFNNTGLRVVWPNSPVGGEDCICDIVEDLSGCDCINNTIYKVEMIKGEICWKNMTVNMNKTKILFFEEHLANSNVIAPIVEREYLLSYEVIIKGPPSSPHIYQSGVNDNGIFYLAIEDIYTGHSEIKNYTVIVWDITKYSSTIVQIKQELGNSIITLPDKLKNVMSSQCGPQNLAITSQNIVGKSPPAYLKVESNDTYDSCECIFKTVAVQVSQINATSDSMYLQIHCQAPYDDLDGIVFKLLLEAADSDYIFGNCSETIVFNNLKSDTTYYISNEWNHCRIGNGVKVSTVAATTLWSRFKAVILGITLSGVFIIACTIISIIIAVCCFRYCVSM